MSEKIDQFGEDMRTRLAGLEMHLTEIRTHIADAVTEDREEDEAKREELRQKVEAQRSKLDESRASFRERAAKFKEDLDEKIAAWKAARQSDLLEDRAQDASDYAATAIAIEAMAIDEAELATLDAVDARRDADASAVEAEPTQH